MTKKDTRSKKKKNSPQPNQTGLPLTLAGRLGKDATLSEIIEHYNTWLPKYQEFSQGRSNFQIEKMIATEHVTPAASYQHTLYQLRVLHQALMQDIVRGIERTREIAYKWRGKSKEEPQWWDLERGGKKLTWYDTDHLQLEHEMEELKMSVKDKLLQMQTFADVLASMEKKHGRSFTTEDLNEEEPEYWKLRLARQMSDEYLDHQAGLGTGNIKSLRMAIAQSPLENSKNVVTDFPDIFNAVLGGPEEALKILNEINDRLLADMNSLGENTQALEAADSPKKTKNQKPVKEKGKTNTLKQLEDVGISVSKLEE